MSQIFTAIDPTVPSGDTGTTQATKLNNWRAALLTFFSGTSRPTDALGGLPWLDTTSPTLWLVKQYVSGVNDVTWFQIDVTNRRIIMPGAVPWIIGTGTANALTATFVPALSTTLIDGTLVRVRSPGANTIVNPTFSPNGATAKTIVKYANVALVANDIAGAGHELLLQYSLSLDKWVLLNPAALPANAALLDIENQALTGGVAVTEKDLGTIASGTLTVDPGDRPLQRYINNGPHTLGVPTVVGSTILTITNGASAGTITTTGIVVKGDAFTTVNGAKFRCGLTFGNGGALLQVQAMQ